MRRQAIRRPRRRHPARRVRGVRHSGPPRRRGADGARPPRAAASRPGSGGHRHLRRPAVPLRAPARPRRRPLHRPRDPRPHPRPHGDGPRPLLDHRRDDPPQRAAAVRRARSRRHRHRPQRQLHQRPDAAPPAHRAGRDLPVDLRHRGRAPPHRPLAQDRVVRPLRRCARRISKAPTRWSRSPAPS